MLCVKLFCYQANIYFDVYKVLPITDYKRHENGEEQFERYFSMGQNKR